MKSRNLFAHVLAVSSRRTGASSARKGLFTVRVSMYRLLEMTVFPGLWLQDGVYALGGYCVSVCC